MDHDQQIATLKVSTAWFGLSVGSFSVTTFLTLTALGLTIIFTGLQIWKIIRDIRRDIRMENLQAKLQNPVEPAGYTGNVSIDIKKD